MKNRLIVLASLVLLGCFSELKQGKVVSSYDEYKQQTVVQWQGIVKPSQGVNRLLLTFSGIVEKPETIAFRIESSSEDWAYLKCNEINLLADGQKVEVGDSQHQGNVNAKNDFVRVEEAVTTILPADSIRQIVQAKEVKGRICKTEFTLSTEQIKSLGTFAYQLGLD